ncbi:MAG: DUF354 domain-containing protein [Cyclobacteriaceae bacterium]
MRYLFFFVHPSKFHVFKHTINRLKRDGHDVEVLITSKDILEQLVKNEGWDYTNIFPEGRKMDGVPAYVSSTINLFRTIYRLYNYCKGKKYDLFITDDLLVYIGKLQRVPTIVFTDDDLSTTKQFSIVLAFADYILSPDITDLAKYNKKKISFSGYKELAYLHPDIFRPNKDIIRQFNPKMDTYFLLRLVSMRSYHDTGKKGLSDRNVWRLIELLEYYGKVFISAERKLPTDMEKYRLKLKSELIAHAIFYADLFIGDSQTMTSEAVVLGTPAFRCNDFVGNINVMDEKENKYGLSFNYKPENFEKMYERIKTMLNEKRFKDTFQSKRNVMLAEKINLTGFMIWLLENYPDSVEEIRQDPQIQYRFL